MRAYRRFSVRFLSFRIFVLPFFETVIVLVFGADVLVVVVLWHFSVPAAAAAAAALVEVAFVSLLTRAWISVIIRARLQ